MDHIFININQPSDALQLAKRTTVRSHVARRQWKNHAAATKNRKKKREEYLPIRIQLDCSVLHEPRSISSASAQTENKDDDKKRRKVQSTGVQTMVSMPPLPVPPAIGGLRVDPFCSYPIPWRSFLPQLVDHYLVSMAVDIPELDQPGNRGLLRTRWFPLVMTEPSLFHVIMLLAASHHATVYQQQQQQLPTTYSTTTTSSSSSSLPDPAQKLNLLTLRSEAITSINTALDTHVATNTDPTRNDALIGAIAKMASYEAMFGNLETYTVHMQGLHRVVNMRGGLDCLEGLGGLLRRIVVWIDRNSAFLNGSGLYFPGATFVKGVVEGSGERESIVEPNPGHFLGAS